ncbi:MAG: DUF5050 domain-containing protein [Lachnospiraceae bacterium]|nr:DUF5050 domain-containing protein [Lachnospiraceae bacterium]
MDMKRKILGAFVFVLLIVQLCACGNAPSNQIEGTTIDLQNVEEEAFIVDAESLAYEEGVDAQAFLYGAEVTKGEEGYYFWDEISQDGLGMLMYYDTKTEQSVPLCNKPNCTHDNVECNANFNRACEGGEYFDRTFIQYYDGSVYIMGYDTQYNVNLYKVAADGSSYEKCMKLYKAEIASEKDDETGGITENWLPPKVVIHRGYVYYLIRQESTPTIRRIRLGGDETETVYVASGDYPSIDWLKFYGDHLFFCMTNYENEEYESYDSGIVQVDLNTGESSLIKKGNVDDFVVYNQKLFYSTEDGVNCMDFETQEDKNIVTNNMMYSRVAVDDNYIYVYNWDYSTLNAYSYNGEMVASVVDEKVGNCWMGDDQFFFARGTSEKELINLTDFVHGDGKWQSM